MNIEAEDSGVVPFQPTSPDLVFRRCKVKRLRLRLRLKKAKWRPSSCAYLL